MIEISMQQFLDIAERDLLRLGRKHGLSVEPKSASHIEVWRSGNICLTDYGTFKIAYLYAEDCLRSWMDDQLWIRGIDFYNRWLTLRAYKETRGSFQFLVHEKYEPFGT